MTALMIKTVSSPSVVVLNVKNYTCPFLFQQDPIPLTSDAGPPKVVAYRLNP